MPLKSLKIETETQRNFAGPALDGERIETGQMAALLTREIGHFAQVGAVSARSYRQRAMFRRLHSVPLRDFNTAGVMSAPLGMRMDQMRQGVYQALGRDVQVKEAQLREARSAVDDVISALGSL